MDVIQELSYFENAISRGGGGWSGRGGGGQGGCEPRIEVIVKMQKQSWGEGVGSGCREW